MKKHIVILLSVVVLAIGAACLQEAENPVLPTALSAGVVTVDEGFTAGVPNLPYWPTNMTGEFSAFTLRWTEVDNAQYYEVRASETPITTENWYDATMMTAVQAPADTANVIVRVEVQEESCIACGLCEQVCPMDAIEVQGGVAVIDYDLCTACGQCMDVCPVDAITGTRYGKDYYFGIRAFIGEETPAVDIAVSEGAWKLIYYNNYSFDNTTNRCQRCIQSEDSLGCYGGCYVLNDFADQEREKFCGYGCPVDAIWQDTLQVGDVPNMIYIDYDDCINCGQCLLECWNYNEIINPDPTAYFGMRSFKRRVVPAGWVTDQPLRP